MKTAGDGGGAPTAAPIYSGFLAAAVAEPINRRILTAFTALTSDEFIPPYPFFGWPLREPVPGARSYPRVGGHSRPGGGFGHGRSWAGAGNPYVLGSGSTPRDPVDPPTSILMMSWTSYRSPALRLSFSPSDHFRDLEWSGGGGGDGVKRTNRTLKISVSDYVGTVKGRTAIRVFNRFQHLKRKPYWGNHFADTVGLESGLRPVPRTTGTPDGALKF